MYRPQFQSCIEHCLACAVACDRLVSGNLLPDVKELAGLALDCAQLCRASASAMARQSDISAELCRLCEEVCERCTEAAGMHDVEYSRQWGEACRLCAAECRRMLASLRHGAERKPTGGPYAG